MATELWAPKFKYPTSSGTSLTLTRSMRHWTERMATVGGFRESASGTARASRVIRRDHLLDTVVRITEGERAALRAMVAWAHDNPGTGIDLWPDVATVGTVFVVYLVSPMPPDELTFQRNAEFPSDLETLLTWRRTNGTPFDLVWYDS